MAYLSVNQRDWRQPESTTNNITYQPLMSSEERYVIYNNAHPANIAVRSGQDSGVQTNSNSFHDHPGNPSMSENNRSLHHPTDDTESTNLNGTDEEQFTLRSLKSHGGNMNSYHHGVVVLNSRMHLRQQHESLPNLSLPNEPQGSSLLDQSGKVVLPNRSAMLGEINQSGYQSQAGRTSQNVSQNKVVLPNRSATLGEVNWRGYQDQAGRASRNISQNKVVFPNHSAMLGKVNQNGYQNQAGRTSQSISQDQMGKVVFPNRSAILGELNQNLPLGTEPSKEPSAMSLQNRRFNEQNPHNITVPPNIAHIPTNSAVSMARDQGGYEVQVSPYSGTSPTQPMTPPPPNHGQQTVVYNEQYSTPNQQHLPSNQQYSAPNLEHFFSWQQQYPPNQHHSAPVRYQVPSSNQIHPLSEKKNSDHSSGLQANNGKKVFILHFGQTTETLDGNPVLKLATILRGLEVDVTLDLFEHDIPPNNWPLWYEQKIKQSDVVLCIINEHFYHQLTNKNHIVGYSVYNLMNSSSSIAFRAVFIDAEKEMEYVPPAMRGATCYSLSSTNFSPNDEEFANLYAFLTGQNRVKKPELGRMVILAPKKSRFGQFSGGPAPAPVSNGRNFPQHQQQRVAYHPVQPQPPLLTATPAVNPPGGGPDVEQANFIFTLLGGDATPIRSVRFHNKMFMQLASKMMTEWEPLARMLYISEADMYAIKVDNIHSVTEQAVQMFQRWQMKNGSGATLGVLTTAVYDSGPQYWNLLDIISKYAPQH